MYNHTGEITIDGIPVRADSSLSREEINKLFYEIIQSWTWEGKIPGRIEFIRDGLCVHICAYEQPFTKVVPVKITTEE